MSKLIAQLADVLEEIVRVKQRQVGFRSARQLRQGAVSHVAKKYGVTENTVADGFIRRLRPDIGSTAEFDTAVDLWLKGKPRKLTSTLLQHIKDAPDAARVFEAIEAWNEARGS